MKKVMLGIFALASLHAQNLVGVWQGTLQAGPQALRTVITISMGDDKLKAVLNVIEQPGPGIPAGSITKDGLAVKMTVPAVNGTYEGKLSADGNTITGTWTQGAPLPLVLTRATPATAWAIPEPPPPPKMMAANANPSFEVATIKPSKPEERFSILVNRSGVLNTSNTSLSDLIKFAYDLHPRQIVGGPAWVESEKFTLMAKPDSPGMPSLPQMKKMMKALLTDRFQLTFHMDNKELSAYAIQPVKTGIKMKTNDGAQGSLPGFGGGGPRGLNVRNATMQEFASMLQANILERPVVDQSGLGETRYDFILKWTPDGPQPGAGAAPANPDVEAPPDLFTAFQQQLGLKLESVKTPVSVMVIDKVEKPSAN